MGALYLTQLENQAMIAHSFIFQSLFVWKWSQQETAGIEALIEKDFYLVIGIHHTIYQLHLCYGKHKFDGINTNDPIKKHLITTMRPFGMSSFCEKSKIAISE